MGLTPISIQADCGSYSTVEVRDDRNDTDATNDRLLNVNVAFNGDHTQANIVVQGESAPQAATPEFLAQYRTLIANHHTSDVARRRFCPAGTAPSSSSPSSTPAANRGQPLRPSFFNYALGVGGALGGLALRDFALLPAASQIRGLADSRVSRSPLAYVAEGGSALAGTTLTLASNYLASRAPDGWHWVPAVANLGYGVAMGIPLLSGNPTREARVALMNGALNAASSAAYPALPSDGIITDSYQRHYTYAVIGEAIGGGVLIAIGALIPGSPDTRRSSIEEETRGFDLAMAGGAHLLSAGGMQFLLRPSNSAPTSPAPVVQVNSVNVTPTGDGAVVGVGGTIR